MAKEKFYLIFSEEPTKKIQINEPIGFSDVDFNCDQKENGFGRDVTFSGGTVKFKFTIYRHDAEFEKILYYAHYYGFEADVKLIIVLEDGSQFIGELDFYTAESNDFNYFDCSVILESSLQIFKRRSETKVDLFASTTIDGEVITPLQPLNMLLKAKPSTQISIWQKPTLEDVNTASEILPRYFNPAQNLIQSDILDSTTFFQTPIFGTLDEAKDAFLMITAQSTLKNVKITMPNLKMNTVTSSSISELRIYINNEYTTLRQLNGVEQSFGDISFNIPSLNRGDKVSMFFIINGGVTVNFDPITITAESTAYNTITPTFRLIDVMKQVAKSIAGMEVYAPRYDNGGQFYDNVFTSGKLLGGNITDPFYVSWKDIEDIINPEGLADNEIQIDGRVFQGLYEDFHTGNECFFFDKTQFSSLVRKPNPMYCLNTFNYKYDSYQSLKENTEPNSESTIHGQSINTFFNKKVENSKECTIKGVRDAILLDVQQRLSTKVSKDTATQDDDKIFVIDTIETENDQKFTESTNLQHTFSTLYLSLRSNGDVNFIVLGIKTGTTFTIEYPDPNAGDYNVYSVTNTELQLQRISAGSISSANDGARLTKYTYEIKQETIPLTNRTNEGFTAVTNLISPEKYSNLRYSVQRNIKNYYNQFLATVNLYWNEKPLRNTYYKNNGKCETEYAGLHVIEKEDWIPTDPIVTPYMYEGVVFANVDFSDFIQLQNNIRTQRGFIRTIDHNKRVLKLYPIKMSYENRSRKLTVSGQEKFEKAYLTIVKENGIVTVNNETKLRRLNYRVEDGNKISLYDLEEYRLYNPVYWDKITINGANAETLEILKSWLDLL